MSLPENVTKNLILESNRRLTKHSDNDQSKSVQPEAARRSYRDAIQGGKSATPFFCPTIRSILNLAQESNVALEHVHAEPTADGRYINPAELEAIGQSIWANTLVGYFVGRKLPFQAVNRLAHLVWDSRGLLDVILHENGVYFFRFDSSKHLNSILGSGHWQFARCPVILCKWHNDINLTPEEPKTIPIWAKLHGIPSNMAHVKGISYVAGHFGHPLLTDALLAN